MSVSSSLPTQKRMGEQYARYLDLGLAILVIGRCAWVFSALLRSPDLPLRLAQDDFYYYLKPAQNLAWNHQSVFFEHVLTNGYHPLYFLLLTAVSFFLHTLPSIFRFLWLLDTVSAAAIFLVVRRLFARCSSPMLANGLAVLVTALCVPLICAQMEVTLALPLGFAFLLAGFVPGSEMTPRRLMALGFLGALTFLARLDAGILVFLWVLGALCTREYRAACTPKAILSFAVSCLPLPLIYLWINHHYFQTLLPISGMAKELRHTRVPSLLVPTSFNGTTELVANLTIITAVLAWALRRYLSPRERVFVFATVAAPIVFYVLEMFLSDWPLWPWYFYALRFPAVGAGILIAVVASRCVVPWRYPRIRALLKSPAWPAALCAAAIFRLFLSQYNVDRWMVEIQHAAGVLDDFAAAHPGVYAMGDRAGMFAITQPNPVLQAEGLVMNRSYLEHIRRQEDLRSVLSQYGVNFYVAFVFKANYKTQFRNNCFRAREPSIPGPDVLRMSSVFCEKPIYEFPAFDGKYMIFRINPS